MKRLSIALICVPSLIDAALEPPDFADAIQPILNKHCTSCHGGVKQKGGLNLSNRRTALKGGESGRTLLKGGDLVASELYQRISHQDPDERMPPKKALGASELALIKAWIAGGADWPEHWAYCAPAESGVPDTRIKGWPVNEIDHLVLAALEARGIAPSPETPPHTLLRRLHLDLVGLPPTIEQIEAFQSEWARDPKACLEATVDRLLASPHFGERWGRHWLDQARYADSDGYEKDNARPQASLWRDWVIDAINNDLPFDQFTIEQLAGDLLPDATLNQRVATAFHRQTLFNREGGVDPEEDRTKRTIDRLATTARTWLGLTLECAQCHDHPYDPITQRDFYRIYAFFNNADEDSIQVPSPGGGKKREAHVMKRNGNRKTFLFERGDFLQPDTAGGEIRAGGIGFLPSLVAGDEAAPTRLDLARWLVDGENPLTARVTVNTIWSHLFGAGLCDTPDNFGSQGNAPSHPALLDWLARKFVADGWSRKSLIRTIVLSRTYRQSSKHRPELGSLDPRNRLLHRQNRRRVEAEIVRDLHLSVAGLLDDRIGGKSVFPPIPPDVAGQSYANNFKWKESTGPDRYRRGMYTFFKRTAPDPNLMTFDCPDSNTSTTQRTVSNTPLMALTSLQNVVFHEAAQALARRVLQEGDERPDSDRLRHAWLLCLARTPSDRELQVLAALLRDNQAYYADHSEEAAALVASSPPSGLDPAQLAAWIATCRIITNLDEFVTCQ